MKRLPALGSVLLLALQCLGAIEPQPVRSLLVVGDSITRHAPSAKLGWSGNWGMAAPSEDRDWVHLLHARLTARQGGTAADLRIDAEGGGKVRDKLKRLEAITTGSADLVVVQLGENDNTPELTASFEADYTTLVAGLRTAYPQARILCFGVWTGANGDSPKDGPIRRVCAAHGAEFVSLSAANADPANRAGADGRWTVAGVNWHPGERGMVAYADAAWAVIERGPGTEPAPPAAEAVPPTVPPAVQSATLLNEGFADAAAVAKTWRGLGAADDGAWRISLEAPATAKLWTPLVPGQIAGKRVKLSARMRSDNVSTRPKAWNGIKVQLATVNAEGEKWFPQAQTTDGSQGWTTVEKTFDVPANIVKADVMIGLENVSGIVWFDDVRVEVVGP